MPWSSRKGSVPGFTSLLSLPACLPACLALALALAPNIPHCRQTKNEGMNRSHATEQPPPAGLLEVHRRQPRYNCIFRGQLPMKKNGIISLCFQGPSLFRFLVSGLTLTLTSILRQGGECIWELRPILWPLSRPNKAIIEIDSGLSN